MKQAKMLFFQNISHMSMKSTTILPQETANIEKALLMTIIYINRLDIQQKNFPEIITVFRPYSHKGACPRHLC